MAKAVKENSLTAFNPENDAKAEEVSEEKASEENVTEAADGNNAENQSDADFDACSVPSNDADETQGNGSVDFASAPREINAGGESVNNCQPEENADMNARKDSVLSDSGADSDALKINPMRWKRRLKAFCPLSWTLAATAGRIKKTLIR